MKSIRIFLASVFILASIFRMLPHSIFDLFHNHQHAFNLGTDHEGEPTIHGDVHFCSIDQWNFESFDSPEILRIAYYSSLQSPELNRKTSVASAIYLAENGRGPPFA